MSNQKGFSKVAIIIIIIILILIGGAYFVFSKKGENIPAQNTENESSQPGQSLVRDLSISTSFKESGSMIKNNSVWNFTVRNSKNDSWSEEGPFKLKFAYNSMCQSTRVKSIKCADFSLLNNYYNSIEIEGTKNADEISVLNLTIIQ